MKAVLYKSDTRGYANHGWLQATHSFSFANYHDPKRMGFGTHPHNNMEIITIPLSGVLKHRDSMHNEWQTIEVGEVQVMSAGSGLSHSEMNGSNDQYLSLFQIWILPDADEVTPRYDQKNFKSSGRKNKLQTLVTSIDENYEGSLKIHQNVIISRIDLDKGKAFEYTLKSKNHGVYLMNIHGEIIVDNQKIDTRDALGISETDSFLMTSNESSELLFIEVPM